MDDLGIDDLRPAQSTHGGGGGQERGSLTRPHNASAKVEPGGFYLKFLQRDEWFALIPLQVLVQRICDISELAPDLADGTSMYPVESEGAFELTLRGINAGLIKVGTWSVRLDPASLSARLEAFYAQVCPPKLGNVKVLATDFAGREDELNAALLEAYGRCLSNMPSPIKYRARRAAPLTYVLEIVDEGGAGKGAWAVTFPGPAEKRVAFLMDFEEAMSRFVEIVDRCGEVECVRSYRESSVPESVGLLKQDDDGSSYYGKRIHAGSHRVADGLRDGSAWLANKMVAAQERASDWAGPAKEEANVHPNVAKGLEAAQEGTGRLLDATKDLLGGLAAVASRGVSWAADKIAGTDTYKEWEKQPAGPRAKAAYEIAGSAFGGIITVGNGVRDATNHLLDHGVKPSVVRASERRWGKKAGDAAEKSVSSVLNVHYAALYGAKFVMKPAAAVVDKLAHLALIDTVTRAVLIEDLKAGPPVAEGSLLLNEFSAIGGVSSVWTNYVLVLRRRCLALYVVVPAPGAIKGNPGVTLGEKGDGHKIVVATRGDRDILVRPGDVIVGVGGYSVKAMSCEDVEALLEGPPGTCIAVSLVRADEVQGVADEAMAAEPDSPKLDGGEEDGCKGAKADVTVAEGASAPAPRMVQVCLERLFVDEVPAAASLAVLAEEGRGWIQVVEPTEGGECPWVNLGEVVDHGSPPELGAKPVAKGGAQKVKLGPGEVGSSAGEAALSSTVAPGEATHLTATTRFGELMRLVRVLPIDDVKYVKDGYTPTAKGTHTEVMPFVFSVQTNEHKKPFLFQCSSESGMKSWVECLGTTVQNYKDGIKAQKIFG